MSLNIVENFWDKSRIQHNNRSNVDISVFKHFNAENVAFNEKQYLNVCGKAFTKY